MDEEEVEGRGKEIKWKGLEEEVLVAVGDREED